MTDRYLELEEIEWRMSIIVCVAESNTRAASQDNGRDTNSFVRMGCVPRRY